MNKQEILDIVKDLIYIAGSYSKIANQQEKLKLFTKFEKYEKQLSQNNTKYAEVILSFLIDLKEDLLNNRVLNIDKLSSDEHLQNFLFTKNEVFIFNKLILKDSYKKIFTQLNKKNEKIIDTELKKLISNFNSQIKLLNLKIIAQNLLIFVVFYRKLPLEALNNLKYYLNNSKQKNQISHLIETYINAINSVKIYGKAYYNKGNFNYKYLKFTKNNQNNSIELSIKASDASLFGFKTGNPNQEYKKLLMKL